MDKQNEIYPYNGIVFILKKEENTDICYNTMWMNLANIMPSERSQVQSHILYSIYMKYPE